MYYFAQLKVELQLFLEISSLFARIIKKNEKFFFYILDLPGTKYALNSIQKHLYT